MTTTLPPFAWGDAFLVLAASITFLVFFAGHLALHPKIRNGAMLSETQSRIAGLAMIGGIWSLLEIARVLTGGMALLQPVWDWWCIVGVAGVTVIILWLGLGNPREAPQPQAQLVLDQIRKQSEEDVDALIRQQGHRVPPDTQAQS